MGSKYKEIMAKYPIIPYKEWKTWTLDQQDYHIDMRNKELEMSGFLAQPSDMPDSEATNTPIPPSTSIPSWTKTKYEPEDIQKYYAIFKSHRVTSDEAWRAMLPDQRNEHIAHRNAELEKEGFPPYRLFTRIPNNVFGETQNSDVNGSNSPARYVNPRTNEIIEVVSSALANPILKGDGPLSDMSNIDGAGTNMDAGDAI
ncbi:hypothetical protein HDV00_003256 [Rhizophlyctis rosea]|nr:hypothetical protein HDV00_003256 [Rhizophlyctis rosea]